MHSYSQAASQSSPPIASSRAFHIVYCDPCEIHILRPQKLGALLRMLSSLAQDR